MNPQETGARPNAPWPDTALAPRSDGIDVLKGFGIFFVVTNHCFARTSRKFGESAVTDDAVLYFINRFIHFAVPVFLFVSCALLASSLSKRFDLRRYAGARWRKTVVPYLVASALYSVWGWGAPWVSLMAAERFVVQVLTGKASFHLYFTVVLIQAALTVPLLVWLLGGRRLDWRLALGIAMVLQWGFYLLQRDFLLLDRPGSFLFWYWVPLLVGLAVGTNREVKSQLRPWRGWLLAAALGVGVIYSFASIADLVGRDSSSDLINGTYALYTGLLAVSLWGWMDDLPRGQIRRGLQALGSLSLPVFLVHPAIMFLLGGPRATEALARLPAPGVIYWALTISLSVLLAAALVRTWIGRWVLGMGPVSSEPATVPRAGMAGS